MTNQPDTNCPKTGSKPTETADNHPTKQHKDFKTAPKQTDTNKTSKPDYSFNKRAFGRPAKYRPKYCKSIIEYFTREHTIEYEETHTNRKGETWSCFKLRANPVPTLQGFSASVYVNLSTLREWASRFPDFSRAYSYAQALQLDHLATVTGLGLYNSNWAVFMAKNVSEWRDKRDVEHSGQVDLKGFVDKMLDKADDAVKQESRFDASVN